jgi:hypothetical protein
MDYYEKHKDSIEEAERFFAEEERWKSKKQKINTIFGYTLISWIGLSVIAFIILLIYTLFTE